VVTIREIREAHGLTERQFANRLAVTTSTVRDWDRGTPGPNRRHLRAIAGLFDVDADAIGGAQPSRSAALSVAPAPRMGEGQ
jgi:transcriptional regulator with XRE-family HTH domain